MGQLAGSVGPKWLGLPQNSLKKREPGLGNVAGNRDFGQNGLTAQCMNRDNFKSVSFVRIDGWMVQPRDGTRITNG